MAQTILHRRSAAQDSELGLTLAGLPDEWMVVSDCAIGDGPMVAFVLLHPAIGLALVDCTPQRPADAIPFLEEALTHERFDDLYPGTLPIAAVQLAPDEIAAVGDRLAEGFDALPACSIADPDWCRALVDLLLAASEVAMTPIRPPEDDSLRIPPLRTVAAAPARSPAAETSEIPPEIVAIVAPVQNATATGSPHLDLGGSGRMPLSTLAAPGPRYRGVLGLSMVVAVLALLVLGGAYLLQTKPALLARLGFGAAPTTPTAASSVAPTMQTPPASPVASVPATPQPVAPLPKIAAPTPVPPTPVIQRPASPAPATPAPAKPAPVVTLKPPAPARVPAVAPAAIVMPPLPAEKPVFHRPAPRRAERRAAVRVPERPQRRSPAAPVSREAATPAPAPAPAALTSGGDLPPINAGDLPALPSGSSLTPPADGAAGGSRTELMTPAAPPSAGAPPSGPPMRLFPAGQ